MHHEPVEFRMPEVLEDHDRFGGWLALAIVVTTLAGALVAYLQAGSLFEHDEAVARAQQWATLSTSQQDRAHQAAQAQIDRFHLAHRARVRAQQAAARRIFGVGNDPVRLALEARRWRELAHEVDQGSALLAGRTSAEFAEIQRTVAPAFPNVDPVLKGASGCKGGHAEGVHDVSAGQNAKATGAAGLLQTSSDVSGVSDRTEVAGGADPASTRATRSPPPLPLGADPNLNPTLFIRYVAKSRREGYRLDALRDAAIETAESAEKQFTRYAVSLAVFAVAVFLFGYALTPYGRRFRRLYATVAGVFAFGAAGWGIYSYVLGPEHPNEDAAAAYADGRVELETGRYGAAIRSLNCAIDLREGFAPAYLARSEAYSFLGNPQKSSTIINEGLTKPGRLDHALEDAKRAKELESEDPQLLNDLATNLYVRGIENHSTGTLESALSRHEEAREALPNDAIPAFNTGTTLLALGRHWQDAYSAAERLMFKSDPEAYVAAALTDLEFLAASHVRPHLTADTRAAKEHVVVADSGAYGPAAGGDAKSAFSSATPALRRISVYVTPGGVQVSLAASKGFDPLRDRLFAAWYSHTGTGWAALPTLTGPITNLKASGDHQFYAVTQQFAPTPCLSAGRYRLELYLNGHLLNAGVTRKVDIPPLQRVFFGDLKIGTCLPDNWHAVKGTIPGVAVGYVGRLRNEGVLLFDVSAGLPGSPAAMTRLALDHFGTMLPHGMKPAARARSGYFMGLNRQTERPYAYPGGRAVVGTGTARSGRKLVGVIFAPSRSFTQRTSSSAISAWDLLYSLSTDDINF